MIVATPFKDEAITLATQPAITLVSRQVRSEALKIFYANSTFVAYINDFEFQDLVTWAQCVTSNASPPHVTVHIKLLSSIACIFQLLNLARGWRGVEHSTLHFKIHNCYAGNSPVIRNQFDQRALVVRAIRTAEDLRRNGDHSERSLLEEFTETVTGIGLSEQDHRTRAPCMVHGGLCIST